MTLPLCDEHVTMVAFTAAWCGHCKAIKPELDLLRARPQTDFHFLQFDTTDVENEQLFKDFNIEGFPTILRFDPKSNLWKRYQGERTASAIYSCTQTPTCGDKMWPNFPAIMKTPHSHEVKKLPENLKSIFHVCSDHPTLFAFTGVNWCDHCVDAQPKLDTLKADALKTHLFHVKQYDWVLPPMEQTATDKEAERIIQEFKIASFPTFIVYDNFKKVFVQVRDIEGLSALFANPEALEGFRKTIVNTWPNLPAEYEEQNCPPEQEMTGATPSMVVFVQDETLAQEEEQADVSFLALDFCGACPTIIAFTGKEWCDPCKAVEPEMKLLDKYQGCGKHHFKQFDHRLSHRDESTLMAECFGIETWPTYLIFDPQTRNFHHYRGPRKARDMMYCDLRSAPIWPTPRDLAINIHMTPPPPNTQMQQNAVQRRTTNGRLKLCAHCPTVLVFALSTRTFMHLKEPTNKSTDKIHVLHFTNPHADGIVFELFGIDNFPTVLIYSPQLNLFYNYTKNCSSLLAIKTIYYQQPGLKTWNTHPRVELMR